MSQHSSPIIISRKARPWPEIPHDIVTLPLPPSEPTPPGTMAIVTLILSLAAIAVSGFIFAWFDRGSNPSLLPTFIAMGVFAAVGSLLTFLIQLRTTHGQRKYLLAVYKAKLQKAQKELHFLQQKEQQARIELDPPFVPSAPSTTYDQLAVTSLIQRSFNEQDLMLWSRRPEDPDFLSVRIGMGSRPATFQVSGDRNKERIALPGAFDTYNAYAYSLMEKYATLVAPFQLKLNEHGPLAIVSVQHGLAQARDLLRSMVSHLAYHHSPEDVRIMILAPQSQEMDWQWALLLPHTQLYDSHQPNLDASQMLDSHMVSIGPEAVVELLPLISRELSRRELILGDERQKSATSLLPHLIIVIDHFDPTSDLDPPPLPVPVMTFGQPTTSVHNRSRLTVSPLKRAEMTLAFSRGARLGVSVLCVCAHKTDIPATSGITIDLDVAAYPDMFCTPEIELPNIEQLAPKAKRRLLPQRKRRTQSPVQASTVETKAPTQVRPQACIRLLRPDPPSFLACNVLDTAPPQALRHFATCMQLLRPATTKRVELRTQVDLRTLFEPTLDLMTYDPLKLWFDPAYRSPAPSTSNGQHATSVPLLRIPIGQKIGDEVQYLDLLKDGPHGLLIGQTGSGKSELLQTIITSLAMLYRPTEVTFLLIDYKAGLALEPFRPLPHTIGFLSNVSSPALIQRFITMLRAEAIRREKRLKEGKATPRLVIIIDEFAEMAKRTETVLDELFTITRVGREIGMHLLLAAQRPEGIIGTKVRDYVQYRLCLRCASPDDSREVLGRPDAAQLPTSIPGRSYLLHGDNQLDLFQAARATIPVPYS